MLRHRSFVLVAALSAITPAHLPIFLLVFAIAVPPTARAVVVNVNARSNSQENPAQILLNAGTYAVTPLGAADGGAFNAWSAWRFTTCSDPEGCQRTSPTTFTGWLNAYTILSADLTHVSVDNEELAPVADSSGLFTFFLVTPSETKYRADDGFVYPADIVALANSATSTFTLGAPGLVGFAISDSPAALGDNRGGMSLDVTLIPDVLTITSDPNPAFRLGELSSIQLEAINGLEPLSWSVVAGDLPIGMELTADGLLNGTPTELGSFVVVVRAIDDDGAVAEADMTIDVVLVLPPPDIRVAKVGTTAVPGRVLEYFIVVMNNDDTDAADIEILELLDPSQVTLLSVDPPAEADLNTLADASLILWNISNLAAREAQVLSYQVQLGPSVPFGADVVGGPVCRWPFPLPPILLPPLPDIDLNDITTALEILAACIDDVASTSAACVNCFIGVRPFCSCLTVACRPPTTPPVCLSCLGVCGACMAIPGPDGGSCFSSIYSGIRGCYNDVRDQANDSGGSVACDMDEQRAMGPVDPNEKLVLAEEFIQPDATLVYPIHFENIGEVEAIDVFVTDVLEPNLDDSTLELLTPGGSYDPATRTVRWDLLGVNLLPGETGNVLLSIKPLPGLPSGTAIRNSAEIQFEIFEPLVTPEVENIIDTTPPSCAMDPLPPETVSSHFPISWSGADAIGEVESFAIFVSTDGGVFTPSLEGTLDTSATFPGEVGRTYDFFCVAVDTAGNVEDQILTAETTTTVVPLLPVMVDIKPGSFPNSVNPSSSGVIPVAILTTDAFDATTVNPLSVALGPDGATESHGRGHIEDVDSDGDLDLVLHFLTRDTGIQCGDASVSLTGSTFGGQMFEGSDSINTVGCK